MSRYRGRARPPRPADYEAVASCPHRHTWRCSVTWKWARGYLASCIRRAQPWLWIRVLSVERCPTCANRWSRLVPVAALEEGAPQG